MKFTGMVSSAARAWLQAMTPAAAATKQLLTWHSSKYVRIGQRSWLNKRFRNRPRPATGNPLLLWSEVALVARIKLERRLIARFRRHLTDTFLDELDDFCSYFRVSDF